MEPRNKYPAFRDELDIESVREAAYLLQQAGRAADPNEKRALKYQAERVLYPHQANARGLNLILSAMDDPK